jgi:Asp-tRNA(Asn)/Glu-tRNA(Gln) amidotransferase A subunit family amidase
MEGATPQAPSLDTFGVFVRDVEAVPLLVGAAAGKAMAVPRPEGPPRLGLCRTAEWPKAEPSTRALVEGVARALARAGAAVEELELPPELAGLAAAQRDLQALEAARSFRELRAEHGTRLSPVLLDLLDAGERVTPAREAEVRALAERGRAALPAIFERVDVLLTPAAVGEAPLGLGSTGDPAMNRIWTLLGTPAASLPLGRGPAGLPVGIAAVGAPGRDGPLAAACAWIVGARRAA